MRTKARYLIVGKFVQGHYQQRCERQGYAFLNDVVYHEDKYWRAGTNHNGQSIQFVNVTEQVLCPSEPVFDIDLDELEFERSLPLYSPCEVEAMGGW